MSELGQIKQQIMQFSAQVGQAAYNIKQLELDMDKQIGFIEQIIGGASDNADKQMIAALEQAKKSPFHKIYIIRIMISLPSHLQH